jgi:archaeosine synthase alpha-subunit
MTKFFEVQKRDGPARMGKLLLDRQIDTPALITNNDYFSLGSIYGYASLDKAMQAAEALKGQKKLTIGPYVPAALHNEPAIKLPQMEYDGPKGIVVNPFSKDFPGIADVYVLGKAGTLRNPKDLIKTVIDVRNRTHADTALYAPALATPANLAFLVYLGIDLLDITRVVADGLLGRYHTRDGIRNFCELSELPCCCENCQKMAIERKDKKHLIAHNIQKLEEELLSVREQIRSETIREYIERQVRVTPDQTAALRLLDQEHQYLEKRTPQHRRSILFANCAESLRRVEVTRFADRVIKRYKAPKSDVLLLLPCSARKPYSTSRSHRLFTEAIGSHRRYLHEVILTSPLALVPRELEECYPAASYDVPVTGHWDKEERAWLLKCLDTYLEKNKYVKIVSHLDGELEEAIKEHGIDAAYTGGGTNGPGLARLSAAVAEACRGTSRLPDLRKLRYHAMADYYFGQGAGDALLAGNVIVRGREIQDEKKRPLAAITPNGTLALSLAGAKRLEPLNCYIVTIGDFLPKGSLLAPGVIDADGRIRPGDEVIITGEKAFGIGRAKMSGWEMVESRRGVAAELRHIKGI